MIFILWHEVFHNKEWMQSLYRIKRKDQEKQKKKDVKLLISSFKYYLC